MLTALKNSPFCRIASRLGSWWTEVEPKLAGHDSAAYSRFCIFSIRTCRRARTEVSVIEYLTPSSLFLISLLFGCSSHSFTAMVIGQADANRLMPECRNHSFDRSSKGRCHSPPGPRFQTRFRFSLVKMHSRYFKYLH